VKLFFIIFSVLIGFVPQADKYASQRENMVKVQIMERGITDKATLKAMRKVPRDFFVPANLKAQAYDDSPLPIGYGQTISQPYIVAYMTEVSKPTSAKKVLEVGTGSGYQAAILAEIVDTVFTIEIIPQLAREAKQRFTRMGYKNIVAKFGDGYNGWLEHAPFDIIIVTAAAEEIPKPLLDQLAENGRLLIPIGVPNSLQELTLVVKKNGKITTTRMTAVRFVPFNRLSD
jgi:protein-L-isoaspartate(D-aspartate) O-methyltransferase